MDSIKSINNLSIFFKLLYIFGCKKLWICITNKKTQPHTHQFKSAFTDFRKKQPHADTCSRLQDCTRRHRGTLMQIHVHVGKLAHATLHSRTLTLTQTHIYEDKNAQTHTNALTPKQKHEHTQIRTFISTIGQILNKKIKVNFENDSFLFTKTIPNEKKGLYFRLCA